MLLIGTQDSEEDACVGGQKAIPEREHQKSYVAAAFENAYKNDELRDCS